MFEINDVVQFNKNHKWCGCFGIIEEIRNRGEETYYLIGVPVPDLGTTYIFSRKSKKEFEYIGDSFLIPVEEEDAEVY